MANNGKLLEEKLHKALEEHKETNPSHYYRFYDQTSSGGRGHKNDGDFGWIVQGKPCLIECKSTEINTPILQLVKHSKKSREQTNKHKLWHRAKAKSIYFYLNTVLNEVQVFCGESVLAALASKGKLKVIGRSDLDDMTKLLKEIEVYLTQE